jgi:ADP-heptose:LPS heptosyltransferase
VGEAVTNAHISADIERVLVIVLGSLGEAVLATAPMKALRAYHTKAEITVLTQASNVRFFDKSPWVDRIDARYPIKKPLDKVKFNWALRNERYGMIYDLTNSEESEAIFKALTPFPPNWSGDATGCSHPHVDRSRLTLHRLDRHADQMMVCGIGPKEGYAPGLSPLPDLDWTRAALSDPQKASPARHGITEPFALLAPEGAPDDPGKRWPAERYGELANALLEHGVQPVIVGSPAAVSLAVEVRAVAPRALDLVARLDMFSFMELARQSSLAVGSEGDMAIMAAAAGAPTLAIINPNETSVRKAAPRGVATVGLVARNFDTIGVGQVLASARAVAPFLSETHSSEAS